MKSIYTCAYCGHKVRGYGWSLDVPFQVGEMGFLVVELCDRVFGPFEVVCKQHFLHALCPDYQVLRGDTARAIAAIVFPDGSEEFSELVPADWGMGE